MLLSGARKSRMLINNHIKEHIEAHIPTLPTWVFIRPHLSYNTVLSACSIHVPCPMCEATSLHWRSYGSVTQPHWTLAIDLWIEPKTLFCLFCILFFKIPICIASSLNGFLNHHFYSAGSPVTDVIGFWVFWGGGLFRAAPVSYGGSQAWGPIRAVSYRPTPQPQQLGIQAVSSTYTTTQSNTGSLTHWATPGIKPASSWILIRFVSTEPQQEL